MDLGQAFGIGRTALLESGVAYRQYPSDAAPSVVVLSLEADERFGGEDVIDSHACNLADVDAALKDLADRRRGLGKDGVTTSAASRSLMSR